MKIFKRAWISIMRKKINSLVLLLIVFILANVLLTTLTVTSSLKNTKQTVLDQFPPIVSIGYDHEKVEGKDDVSKPTVEMADNLYKKTKDIVKNYDYTLTTALTRPDTVKLFSLSGTEEVNAVSNNRGMTLRGTQRPMTQLVDKEEAKLISGQGFDKADINGGKPKVIISKQFAEANGLEVGSFLTMNRTLNSVDERLTAGDAFFSEDIDLEVAGIIEINSVEEFVKKQAVSPTKNSNDILQIEETANALFCTNSYIYPIMKDSAQRMAEKNALEGLPGSIVNDYIFPEFVLNDMKDLDTFITTAKEIYNEDEYAFTSAASEYEILAKPLDSMENLLSLVFKITVMASVLILTLVLCIFMYLRQKEMGIYLALGERRSKIVSQLLLETIIISIIGATLAIFTALIFSNMLSENTISSLASVTSGDQISTAFHNNQGLTAESITNQYQGGFTAFTLVIFYITMIATIVISQLATVLYLLRLNPKKILM